MKRGSIQPDARPLTTDELSSLAPMGMLSLAARCALRVVPACATHLPSQNADDARLDQDALSVCTSLSLLVAAGLVDVSEDAVNIAEVAENQAFTAGRNSGDRSTALAAASAMDAVRMIACLPKSIDPDPSTLLEAVRSAEDACARAVSTAASSPAAKSSAHAAARADFDLISDTKSDGVVDWAFFERPLWLREMGVPRSWERVVKKWLDTIKSLERESIAARYQAMLNGKMVSVVDIVADIDPWAEKHVTDYFSIPQLPALEKLVATQSSSGKKKTAKRATTKRTRKPKSKLQKAIEKAGPEFETLLLTCQSTIETHEDDPSMLVQAVDSWAREHVAGYVGVPAAVEADTNADEQGTGPDPDQPADVDQSVSTEPAVAVEDTPVYKNLKAELEVLKASLETREAELASREIQFKELVDSNTERADELVGHQVDLHEQEAELKARISELESEVVSMREAEQSERAHREEVDVRERQLAEREVDIESRFEAVTDLESELNDRLSSLQSREAEAAARLASLEKAESDGGDAAVTVQSVELDARAAGLASREATIAECESQLAVQSKELEERHATIQSKEAELEARAVQAHQRDAELESRLDEIEERNAAIQSKEAELEARAVQAHQRDAELGSRLDEIEERNAAIQSKEAELEARAVEAHQREAELMSQLDEIEERDAAIRSKESVLETRAVEAHQREAELVSQLDEIEERDAAIRSQESVLETRAVEAHQREAEMASRLDEIADQEAEHGDVEQTVTRLQADLAQRESEFNDRLAHLESERQTLQTELASRERSLDDRVQELDQREANLDALREELVQHVERIKAWEEELDARDAEDAVANEPQTQTPDPAADDAADAEVEQADGTNEVPSSASNDDAQSDGTNSDSPTDVADSDEADADEFDPYRALQSLGRRHFQRRDERIAEKLPDPMKSRSEPREPGDADIEDDVVTDESQVIASAPGDNSSSDPESVSNTESGDTQAPSLTEVQVETDSAAKRPGTVVSVSRKSSNAPSVDDLVESLIAMFRDARQETPLVVGFLGADTDMRQRMLDRVADRISGEHLGCVRVHAARTTKDGEHVSKGVARRIVDVFIQHMEGEGEQQTTVLPVARDQRDTQNDRRSEDNDRRAVEAISDRREAVDRRREEAGNAPGDERRSSDSDRREVVSDRRASLDRRRIQDDRRRSSPWSDVVDDHTWEQSYGVTYTGTVRWVWFFAVLALFFGILSKVKWPDPEAWYFIVATTVAVLSGAGKFGWYMFRRSMGLSIAKNLRERIDQPDYGNDLGPVATTRMDLGLLFASRLGGKVRTKTGAVSTRRLVILVDGLDDLNPEERLNLMDTIHRGLVLPNVVVVVSVNPQLIGLALDRANSDSEVQSFGEVRHRLAGTIDLPICVDYLNHERSDTRPRVDADALITGVTESNEIRAMLHKWCDSLLFGLQERRRLWQSLRFVKRLDAVRYSAGGSLVRWRDEELIAMLTWQEFLYGFPVDWANRCASAVYDSHELEDIEDTVARNRTQRVSPDLRVIYPTQAAYDLAMPLSHLVMIPRDKTTMQS